jgi:hypothetical protein
LGDSVTTDHISPAGSIARSSAAAKYLTNRGYVYMLWGVFLSLSFLVFERLLLVLFLYSVNAYHLRCLIVSITFDFIRTGRHLSYLSLLMILGIEIAILN